MIQEISTQSRSVRSSWRDTKSWPSLALACRLRFGSVASNIEKQHTGTPFVRMILDSLNIVGPTGNQHQCLLYQPLGMSYTQFLDMFPDKQMPEALLQRSMQLMLLGLDYLHKAKVVHTGMFPYLVHSTTMQYNLSLGPKY